jgi:hypothetical protein
MSNKLEDYNHIGLLFPSNYLSGPDLRGQDLTLTIKDIEPRHELRRSDDTKEHKPAVSFVEEPKLWVLNKTNASTIAGLYGPEAMGWRGKRITLCTEKVRAFGKTHDALRVRSRKPKAAAQASRQTQVQNGLQAALDAIEGAQDMDALIAIGSRLQRSNMPESDDQIARSAYRDKERKLVNSDEPGPGFNDVGPEPWQEGE